MKKLQTIDIPQANTLSLVGDLLALVDAGIRDKETLSKQLPIVPREVEYYSHAARILGFARFSRGRLTVTKLGKGYLRAKTPAEKSAILSDAVRGTKIFTQLLQRHTEAELSKPNIVAFLREHTDLTRKTPGRRADTVVAWLRTISQFDPEDFVSIAKHASTLSPEAFEAYEQREKSSAHDDLKQKIARDPEALLSEPLILVAEEYRFPTNDRADLLFLDSKARHLAVEVEVDVGARDVVGLLQAAKYKALVIVQFGRRPSGVRGMLAARSIHPLMRERASRHGIETRECGQLI